MRIARTLAERIIAGALAPGEKLRQDHVAAEFGASHVPVREAFRRLEAQGLVVGTPRRGVRVAAIDPASLREVAEMRAALEALALRHAAPHLTAAILDRAEAAIEAGEKASDLQAWEAANRRFHELILGACRMPRLLRAIADLQDASARLVFAAWREEWEGRTDRDHRAILADLRAGRVEDAADRLARHVRWSARGADREPVALAGPKGGSAAGGPGGDAAAAPRQDGDLPAGGT
ncbi:GntR family transcriptional regulator [Marinibaculum pumilum]|uniref:GntR family transcriptional regulator n=1 Tax=Marinibaculum pumilum TaxID=1766165 RepID=A0ABV7L7Z7_9PROT